MGTGDRCERPTCRDRVISEGEHGDSGGEREPERGAEPEQAQPAADEQAAGDDHHVGGHHRPVERRPPEVEGFDPFAAEHEERSDESDVRRIEDVAAAERGSRTSWQPGEGRRPRTGTTRGTSSSRRSSVPITRNSNAVLVASGTRSPARRTSSSAGTSRGDFDRSARHNVTHDLGDGHPESEPPDADEEDREDRHRQVDAWVVDVRRHVSVGALTELDRAGEGCVARAATDVVPGVTSCSRCDRPGVESADRDRDAHPVPLRRLHQLAN